MVSAPMPEIHNDTADTWIEKHTDASTKAVSAGNILLWKYAAAKHFHPVA